jgi:hypothetical protein
MPDVSILIPCFNAQEWIAKAIESALCQTLGPREVVVVDDGSNDGSWGVVQRYSDRVTLQSGSNRGGNAARNQLLRMCTGEWVQFLDADDYLNPDKISVQLESLAASGQQADVVYSPIISEVWCDGAAVDRSFSHVSTGVSLEEQWIRWQVAQTGSVLWRRAALLSIGGWNEEYPCCQDNEVTLRAIQAGLRFHFCPHAGAVYRIWSEQTVCRKDPTRVVRYKTKLIQEMLAWLAEKGRVTPQIRAAAGQAFFEMARILAKYDLHQAAGFHHERKVSGWYCPAGPAAPWHYRLVHRVLGFKMAEQIAAWLRR